MEYDRDSTRLSYHGWEIRSHLTSVSLDGTVAAGTMLYFEEACQCHTISYPALGGRGASQQS